MLSDQDLDRLEANGVGGLTTAEEQAALIEECRYSIRYGRELDNIAAHLQGVHPIGSVKAIGRLETELALRQVLEWRHRDHAAMNIVRVNPQIVLAGQRVPDVKFGALGNGATLELSDDPATAILNWNEKHGKESP